MSGSIKLHGTITAIRKGFGLIIPPYALARVPDIGLIRFALTDWEDDYTPLIGTEVALCDVHRSLIGYVALRAYTD